MHITNIAKHWLFRFYLWIAAALFGLLLFVLIRYPSKLEQLEKPAMLTLIGVPFTFIFFVQKQKLEETHLFKELFQKFNSRYDRLNEKLNRIRNGEASTDLTAEDRDILYNYFNLCGEEHLYYQLHFIPEVVWRSWRKGMETFLYCPRIWKEWIQDPGRDSYYGLTFPPPPPLPLCPACGRSIPHEQEAA